MNTQTLVSVIIPAFNEEKVIRTLLASILKQSHKKLEIVVVDDSSTDNTPEISQEYTQKVYVRSHAERSVQRNFGAKQAKGKYLLFLDADMELTPEVVLDCVKATLKDNRIGGLVIPEISSATSFWERVKAFERSFYNDGGDEITDAARFFPKIVFESVGGYDETITGPEDWDLSESIKKAGYKVDRVKSKIIHHERIRGLLNLVRKKYYYALKSHTYLKKQDISPISSKTIYFLRPVFYQKWRKLIKHPILSLAMFTMFFFELFSGGVGYVVGKYFK